MKKNLLTVTLIFLSVISSCSITFAQDLQSSFLNPPPSAWPRAWWHWSNSNVTKEGITKDFEWMKRVGIQGMQLGDVASGGGQNVDKKIVFMSPEWLDAVKYAASEADRLKLEMAMFTSAGWSLTGGPWVKPEQAMKKVVWSEMQLEGGKLISSKLPAPPSNEGAGPNLAGSTAPKGFYRDYAVLAFKTPADELIRYERKPLVSTFRGPVNNAAVLSDENNATGITVPADANKQAWLEFKYAEPYPAKAVTIAGRAGIPFGKIQASTDGVNYRTLATTPGKSGYRGGNIRTYSFPETNARYFRLVFTNVPVRPADVISEVTTLADTAYSVTEIKWHSGARINRWEDKAGFNFLFEYEGTQTPNASQASAIRKNDIVDLTSKMSADGTLNWNAPKGNWTIMRFGYALTGAKNRPAIPAGLGYETDKLSKKNITAYMDNYTAPLIKALGPLYGKSMQYMVMDSWEAGIQNWTDKMPEEFKKRRGYDLLAYMPALSGRVVEDAETSERFLWDFRRSLVDMFAENHYGTLTDYLNKQGVQTYSEAGGVSLESMEDALLNKKYVNIPMGEFWVRDLHPSSMYYEDVRGAASASHIYGKGIVAAESFTGGNYESPGTLKKIADYWFTQGVNRLVFHTSAHQPLDTKPGNTMVGTHINRNITWAELARPFNTYLARNSYMLQKGIYVADIAYLLNEGAPSTMPFWGPGVQPATPEGYSFDYINADALLTRVSPGANGKMTLPDGLVYSVLALPETREMTLPVLRKIKQLVQGGAILIGPKPLKTPGLTGFPSADEELNELTADVWGDLDGASRTQRVYGKGKVIWGLPLERVLKANNILKDFDDNRTLSDVSWIHRRDGDTDIYFVVNRTDTVQTLDARFRVAGKEAELWHADNGSFEPASYQLGAGTTTVPLHLEPRESVYVLFRNKAVAASRNISRPTDQRAKLVVAVNGPWQLQFPSKFGAPDAPVQLAELSSWTSNEDAGIKYFSGTATYTKTFVLKKEMLKNPGSIWIDLGAVGDIAEISVNGGKSDTLWKAPYRAEVGKFLKAGKNTLEIKVTNEWSNRITGDALQPAEKKILAPGPPPFFTGGVRRPSVLSPSGLIGPVKMVSYP